MAGTLEVTEELCWMPAGWVFDTVLERMAAVLHTQEPALAARLLAARTEANGGYLDLRDIDLETWVLLFNAAENAYSRLKQEGAQGFATPAFYEGLLTQFQQLRDMLQAGRKARMRKQ
jgi:hypothetical protein